MAYGLWLFSARLTAASYPKYNFFGIQHVPQQTQFLCPGRSDEVEVIPGEEGPAHAALHVFD